MWWIAFGLSATAALLSGVRAQKLGRGFGRLGLMLLSGLFIYATVGFFITALVA